MIGCAGVIIRWNKKDFHSIAKALPSSLTKTPLTVFPPSVPPPEKGCSEPHEKATRPLNMLPKWLKVSGIVYSW
jgi:hypothetical protein